MSNVIVPTQSSIQVSPDSVVMVTIDHSKGKFLLGDIELDSLIGYPVYWSISRSWWPRPYAPGSKDPPQCASLDGIRPWPAMPNIQAEECGICPMSQFGSSPSGRGQACHQRVNVFIAEVPAGVMWLSAPPTSNKTLVGTARRPGYLRSAWMLRFGDRVAGHTALVRTSFTLERGGERHCLVRCQPVDLCSDHDTAKLLSELSAALASRWASADLLNPAAGSVDSQ